jgi:hypothetical protein
LALPAICAESSVTANTTLIVDGRNSNIVIHLMDSDLGRIFLKSGIGRKVNKIFFIFQQV